MQLKAPNHRTIVAKCTDLRHQEPGLQLKQRNDKGLRRAVQAIQFQYMFHVQAFLQPNLHQIVPQVRILDKQNIFGHPCRHMLASKMPTVKWYSSYIIHHGQTNFHCKLNIRHFHGDPQPHNLPGVQEASDQVQNFCFAPKHSSILQRRAAVAGGGSKTVEMLS